MSSLPQPVPSAAANANAVSPRPRVLLLGGGGFVGGFIRSALLDAGYAVLALQQPRSGLAADQRGVELSQMNHADAWLPLLEGIDAVINAAGILRESRRQQFAQIHTRMPLALLAACRQRGIQRFVQISALGLPEDGEFIASKQRFDAALLQQLPTALVLRPSVVYSSAGSYGGTSLLRALAALPGLLWLPGRGEQQIQPLSAEDLAQLVVTGLQRRIAGCYEVGGPSAISLRGYLLQWRRWLGIAGERTLAVPLPLINLTVALGERFGVGPLGQTIWRMLQRGNLTATDAHARLNTDFGFAPRDLQAALAARPSQVQDRWQAQLYLLAPALKLSVVALWLLSAAAGWLTPAATIEHLAADSALAGWQPVALARASAWLDLLLAGALLWAPRPRWVVAAMLLSVLGYTLAFGLLLPTSWLDPLGGLAKNLVILPALAMLWVLLERR